MQIRIDRSSLHQTTWHEYGVRFLSGGTVTVLAGLIGMKWGPGVGGIFLAFPAIFPAAATLIEKHAKERQEKAGFAGEGRARKEVSIDAAGAAIGCIGLIFFAVVVARFIPRCAAWEVLTLATIVWLGVSVFFWMIRKRIKLRRIATRVSQAR